MQIRALTVKECIDISTLNVVDRGDEKSVYDISKLNFINKIVALSLIGPLPKNDRGNSCADAFKNTYELTFGCVIPITEDIVVSFKQKLQTNGILKMMYEMMYYLHISISEINVMPMWQFIEFNKELNNLKSKDKK